MKRIEPAADVAVGSDKPDACAVVCAAVLPDPERWARRAIATTPGVSPILMGLRITRHLKGY